MAAGLSAALLTALAAQPAAAALSSLAAAGLLTPAAAAEAAHLALAAIAGDMGDGDSGDGGAAAWMPLLSAWVAAAGNAPAALAPLRYAQARLALAEGDFAAAEEALHAARTLWQQAGDDAGAARSGLGLTQLLAMGGRYTEAEAEIDAAIAALGALAAGGDAAARLLHLDAQQNRATLLSYQERHAEALALLQAVHAACLPLLAQAASPEDAAEVQVRLALVERDLALAHTYLDQPQGAEALLLAAVERLGLPGTRVERGQTRTNLGHLYNRTGRYAQALAAFDAATLDLLGTLDVDSAPERWPAADLLFLEQASLYLALNLLPEAEEALRRARQLLAASGQQYELGQALYFQGLLAWQRDDLPAAAAALDAAQDIYRGLDNPYWGQRVLLALAAVALRRGEVVAASQAVAALRATAGAMPDPDAASDTAPDAAPDVAPDAAEGASPALGWDQAGVCELHLLDAQVQLARGDVSAAGQAVETAAAALGLPSPDAGEAPLPALHIHLLHLAGKTARAAGDGAAARRLFGRAIEVVEAQRGLLPIEELRAAFLGDKAELYTDLILSLLEAQPVDAPGDRPADAPAADAVAEAFAVVERARSRSLLDRLLPALDEAQAGAGLDPQRRAELAETRSRLAWLYNQLLGPGAGGSRGVTPALSAELRACEAALQRMEWQGSAWLRQAQPATLAQFQAQLAGDQAAVIYYIAGEEVLAFLVGPQRVAVQRNVACVAALEAALAQWRFQLGRVEIGGGYPERHQVRLLAGAREALHGLYDLLLAPLLSPLAAVQGEGHSVRRLLVAPYGPLHQVPFHALWDGQRYLLEAYEIAYTASGSQAVHHALENRRSGERPLGTLAGLALPDPAIPQAEQEVRAAARHFESAALYLNEQAGSEGLQAAAQAGDVLHIATHGVFRADNPFFSALKLADGWIDVRAIYRLPLAARLVVLSACESGASRVQGGDEAVGLARGFLGAGAQALVASLWNVHDASAAHLMDEFYGHLAGGQQRTAAALSAAQRSAARSGRHPYYWAPYLMMGDL